MFPTWPMTSQQALSSVHLGVVNILLLGLEASKSQLTHVLTSKYLLYSFQAISILLAKSV